MSSLVWLYNETLCKALPGCTVGSRRAEHESQGESMEEDDIAKSRVGNTLVQRRNDRGGRRLQARGA